MDVLEQHERIEVQENSVEITAASRVDNSCICLEALTLPDRDANEKQSETVSIVELEQYSKAVVEKKREATSLISRTSAFLARCFTKENMLIAANIAGQAAAVGSFIGLLLA